MLRRNLDASNSIQSGWSDMQEGAPTIMGLAHLCSIAITKLRAESEGTCPVEQLSDEAKTILVTGAKRGTFDIRANRDSFDSADRFLAVCVEHDLDQRLLFLNKNDPEQTIRFLEGFRELCEHGLVIHHLQKDFSLSSEGFRIAKTLDRSKFEKLIAFAVELDH